MSEVKETRKLSLNQLLQLSIAQEMLGNILVVAIQQNKTKKDFLILCGVFYETLKESINELEEDSK